MSNDQCLWLKLMSVTMQTRKKSPGGALFCVLHSAGTRRLRLTNGRDYLSPWSVSAKDAGLGLIQTQTTKEFKSHSNPHPPGSATALKYLFRFCVYHRLYAQCSVALAGAIYIPSLGGRTVYLPFPKHVPPPEIKEDDGDAIPTLLNRHGELLPQYMTLSFNVWGLRSILHSTFFNPDIECNLVSA